MASGYEYPYPSNSQSNGYDSTNAVANGNMLTSQEGATGISGVSSSSSSSSCMYNSPPGIFDSTGHPHPTSVNVTRNDSMGFHGHYSHELYNDTRNVYHNDTRNAYHNEYSQSFGSHYPSDPIGWPSTQYLQPSTVLQYPHLTNPGHFINNHQPNDGVAFHSIGQSPDSYNNMGYSRSLNTDGILQKPDAAEYINSSLISTITESNSILGNHMPIKWNIIKDNKSCDSTITSSNKNDETIDDQTPDSTTPDHPPVNNSSNSITPDSSTSEQTLSHETPINNPYCMFGTGNNIMASFEENVLSNPSHTIEYYKPPAPYKTMREYYLQNSKTAVRNLKDMTQESCAQNSNEFQYRDQIMHPETESNYESIEGHAEVKLSKKKEYVTVPYKQKQKRNARLSKLSLFGEDNKCSKENEKHKENCIVDNVKLKCKNVKETNLISDFLGNESNPYTGYDVNKDDDDDDDASKTGYFIGAPILYTELIENEVISSKKWLEKDRKLSQISSLSIRCCKCQSLKTSHENDSVSSLWKSSELTFTNSSHDSGNFSMRDEKMENEGKVLSKNTTEDRASSPKNGAEYQQLENLNSCPRNSTRTSRKRDRDVQRGDKNDEENESEFKYREMGIVIETCNDVTIVENDSGVDVIESKDETSGRHLCLGCQKPVCDRYVLHVRDHGYWHADCLKCSNCQDNLSTHKSCYVKNEQIFCRNDYNILFGQSCVKCSLQFKKEQDWMRIAGQNRYHIACFLCKICKRQLGNNEKYHLVNGTDIYCTNHYRDMVSGDSSEEGQQPAKKAKRNRTSYTEAQIKFLQERFLHDSNPDGNELEKIANHINLKKRVVQVWFQNNRARLKKTANNTKGSNQDISGQANSKGRVATPGSLSDSALTMDWDNSLDPAILEDQGYISPNTSTATTPTHHQHHLHHHHHPQQQQISPSTPHYQDLFGVSGSSGGDGGAGCGGGTATGSHLHNNLTTGAHHPQDHNAIGSGGNENVCGSTNGQQINQEFPEMNTGSFNGNDSNMTLTSGPNSGNGDTAGSSSNCGDSQTNEENSLSSMTMASAAAASGEDGLNFDPEKMNSLNSLRNSFASEKYSDSFRRMDPRERHEQQIRQMMQYHEQQQQQQQQQHYHQYHQQHPFTSLYTPSTGGGFGLSPYYTSYGAPQIYPGNTGMLGNGCPSPTSLADQVVSPQNFLHHHHQPPHSHPHHQQHPQDSLLQQNAEKDDQAIPLQDPYHNQHHQNHHHHHHQQMQQQQPSPSNFQLSPRDHKPHNMIGTNSDNTIENNNNNNNNKNSNNNIPTTTNNNNNNHHHPKLSPFKQAGDSTSLFDDKISSSTPSSSSSPPTSFYAINTDISGNTTTNNDNNSSILKHHPPTSAHQATSPLTHFSPGRKNSQSLKSLNDSYVKRENGGGGGYRSPISCNSSNGGRNNFNGHPQQQQQQHHQHHHQQHPYQFVPISQNGRMSGNGEIHYYGHGRILEPGQHHSMENESTNDES